MRNTTNMKDIEIILHQTKDAYHWVNELLKTIPFEKWDTYPNVINSTLSWQVGHLIMSNYYHSIMVIKGHQMNILQKVPLKEYDNYYTDGDPVATVGKVDPEVLFVQLKLVQKSSISIIEDLTSEELYSPLEPTPTPHPIAENKLEALDWNIKHTMYHCGQIGILKRIVAARHDFGLRKETQKNNA